MDWVISILQCLLLVSVGVVKGQGITNACQINGTEYVCLGLDEFPDLSGLTEDERNTITSLQVSGGAISQITDGAISNFPSLREVDLSDNDLQTFSPAVFAFTPNIAQILLDGNNNLRCSSIDGFRQWMLIDDDRRVSGNCRTENNLVVDAFSEYFPSLFPFQNSLTFDLSSVSVTGKPSAVLSFSRSGDIDEPLSVRTDENEEFEPSEVPLAAGTSAGEITINIRDAETSKNIVVKLIPSLITFPTAEMTIKYEPLSATTGLPTMQESNSPKSNVELSTSIEGVLTENQKPGEDAESDDSAEEEFLTTESFPTDSHGDSDKSRSFPWWIIIVIIIAIIAIIFLSVFCRRMQSKQAEAQGVKYTKAGQEDVPSGDKQAYNETTVPVENA